MILDLRLAPASADPIPDVVRGGAVSVGNFDGVHRGHAVLLRSLRAMADRWQGPAVAVTFAPHPAALLRPGSEPQPLTTMERRAELLGRLGVDHVVVCQTTIELLGLSAEEFFRRMVGEALAAHGMVEGPNFFFGRNREGDIGKLRALCQAQQIELEIVEPQTAETAEVSEMGGEMGGEMVSSTRIRGLIAAGDVAAASNLLTAPYQVSGRVVRGEQRGSGLGFPTANLTDIETLIPGSGVYASRVSIDGQTYLAATHIGPNLTFDKDGELKVEIHILDFSGDLYGRLLQVDFIDKVRDIARFNSVADLVRQMHQDIARTRQIVSYP